MSGLLIGTTFVDGGTYTAADVNNAVNLATPQPSLVTQWATVTPAATDTILGSDASDSNNLKQFTISSIGDFTKYNSSVYALDTGVANAYVITLTPAPTAYTTGMEVVVKWANLNTTASTININALGAKNIFYKGLALVGGEAIANATSRLVYDGTQFNIEDSGIPNGGITSTQILDGTITPADLSTDTLSKFGVKNQLICAAFQGWQRGTSFSNPATGTAVADGWAAEKANGSGTAPSVNVIRNASIIDTAFDQSCELAITATGTTGASMNWILRQAIEGIPLASTVVVGAIRIRASGSLTLGGSLKLVDSTGTIASTAITALTTAWQTVTVTGTFGAHTANSAKLAFYLADGTQPSGTGSVYVQWGQLERGTTATSFEVRPLGIDQSMAYRLCYAAGIDFKSGAFMVDNFTGTMATATTCKFVVQYPIAMRTTPNFTYSGTNSNDNIQGGGPSNITCNTNPSGSSIGIRSAYIQAASASSLGSGQSGTFMLNFSATTNRLLFEAGI